MDDVQSPQLDSIDPEDYHRVQQSENFQRLKKSFRSFAFPMTVVFLVWYLAYVLGSILARDLMMTPVFGNVSVGFLFGVGQFATTFLITWLYIRHMNRRVDPFAGEIRTELEGGIR